MTTDYPSFVSARLSPNHRELHIALGLLGEWHEYCYANNLMEEIEELGDLCFYLQSGINVFGLSYQLDKPVHHRNVLKYDIDHALHKFADEVKKRYIYGLDNRPVIELFHEVLTLLHHYINLQGVISHIIMDNMNKLSKRYQTQFTPQEAEARKDKCED
jgi:hypothetical protein